MQAEAVWPVFRHDMQNSGCSLLRAAYQGDHPWSYQTGKGIFSTPVVDAEGSIYIGSADHHFYALHPDGSLKWSFETGEIIDSAAALTAAHPGEKASILVPSGDGNLYCLRCDSGSVLWKYDVRLASRTSFNNWWEANVAIGEDGTIYAGNTNFTYYAIHPDGSDKWVYPTGANAWSAAGFAPDGTIYWGSNDTFIHAVTPEGKRKWRRRTLGCIAASAAIGNNGTIYIGSFDSCFYALNPQNGRPYWKFKTQDHIYSSAALSHNIEGHTDAIYFGSADGSMYALNADGTLLWRYDTGAPIRSSPALGRKPTGEEGWIVYFGCGNGKLYALDASNGSRRWSYDTTPDQGILRDRNDLNGSPALGKTGITIGGEHGQIWTIPYDYHLHNDDPRGCVKPGEDFPHQMTGLYYVTPGGNLQVDPPEKIPISTIFTFCLINRKNGESLNTRLYNMPFVKSRRHLHITSNPPFEFNTETSADGRYLHIISRTYLKPGQSYTLNIEGTTYNGGLRIGNLTLGGKKMGRFSQHVTFHTDASEDPHHWINEHDDQVTAFEITRFAVPIPKMLPSLNQIGFDYIDWVVGLVQVDAGENDSEKKVILWAVGGKRNKKGEFVVDPQTNFILPLSGSIKHGAFILSNRNFTMPITGIPIPFNLFQIRGKMGADMEVGTSATAFADTKVLSIPTYGPLLILAGIASNWWKKLIAVATYITCRYGDGPANHRPEGIDVKGFHYTAPTRKRDGKAMTVFEITKGVSYLYSQHLAGILLFDESLIQAVPLNYEKCLATSVDTMGNLQSITLTIPAGTPLPKNLGAVVILDVFPIHRQTLT